MLHEDYYRKSSVEKSAGHESPGLDAKTNWLAVNRRRKVTLTVTVTVTLSHPGHGGQEVSPTSIASELYRLMQKYHCDIRDRIYNWVSIRLSVWEDK
jgi:hypothetical protein